LDDITNDGHPVYRLDPLTNDPFKGSTRAITWADAMAGKEPGVDHTGTYLFYRLGGGLAESSNVWVIGPSIGAGDQHAYAMCTGAFGQDNSNPTLCNTWFVWLGATIVPPHGEWSSPVQGDDLMTNGACPWDNVSVPGYDMWDTLSFCQRHRDCGGHQYCANCERCTEWANTQNTVEIAGANPCGLCFVERTEDEGDDNMCVNENSCWFGERDGEQCINWCEVSGDAVDGNCPGAICAESCLAKGWESRIGDGNCDGQCYGCGRWVAYTSPFDGGDCEGAGRRPHDEPSPEVGYAAYGVSSEWNDYCYTENRSTCNRLGGESFTCSWWKDALNGSGACMYLPNSRPENPSLVFSTNVKAKGQGKKIKYKGAKGLNVTPADCQRDCLNIYESDGPFYAYSLSYNVRKGTALCMCIDGLKKVPNLKKEDPDFVGDIIEGFWNVFFDIEAGEEFQRGGHRG